MILQCRVWSILIFFLFFGLPVWGESTFGLHNRDKDQIFYYWILALDHPLPAKEAAQEISKVSQERHAVAPGENRRETLEPGQSLVGVFVPWNRSLNFRSQVAGGFLLFQDAPAGKTVVLDHEIWASFNSGRVFHCALQDLGIPVPQFDLEGKDSDWNKVPPVARFSAAFQPRASMMEPDGSLHAAGLPGSLVFPRVRSLQAVFFDQCLWIRLLLDASPNDNGSFVWKFTLPDGVKSGLELPWTSKDSGPVMYWAPGATAPEPQAFFSRVGNIWSVWLPLDRLDPKIAEGLSKAKVAFSQVLRFNSQVWELHFVDYSHAELP